MNDQAYVRINCPSVAVRDRGYLKGVRGKQMAVRKVELQSKKLDGWNGGRPVVRLQTEPSSL